MKYILLLVISISFSAQSADVFKCVQSGGEIKYSDAPCPKNTTEEHITYKDLPWKTAIDARKPAGTKILDITEKKKDSLIKYNFHTQTELDEFMRLTATLSGKNVNRLKIKLPVANGYGEALLQVTDKKGAIDFLKSKK